MRVWLGVMLAMIALASSGCGGDNFQFCDGCSTPTPTQSVTPTASTTVSVTGVTSTPFTPTPAPSTTSTP